MDERAFCLYIFFILKGVVLLEKFITFKKINRIVIKIGTSTIMKNINEVNISNLERIVRVISYLHNQGREVVVVSSGAIGMGVSKIGLKRKPKKLEDKQAMAAIGQGLLMHIYEDIFAKYGITVAQMLLTRSDFEDNNRKHNTDNTFSALFKYKVIPIVNENDTVAVEEIVYGDNDTLSAVVSTLIKSELLVMLSDTDGLYTGDPRTNKKVKKLSLVENIDRDIENFCWGAGSAFGTGGMKTKIFAAKIATSQGICVAIIKGDEPEQIINLVFGEIKGTVFLPKIEKGAVLNE